MTRINTNVPSLVAQNRLSRSNEDLQTALNRLSTGLRINSGKDDPAGLIASEALRSEITSLNKAISNTRRANQIISTADSALGQVSNLLNDIRGLVVEAANNGALSPDEVAATQLQVDSSLEAINRIAQTTTFQGRKLLDGSLDFITSSGTNSTSIGNLKIDQANLGATGQVDVNVNVSRAATKALVEVSGFAPGGSSAPSAAATGELTIGEDEGAVAATGTVTVAAAEDAGTASLRLDIATGSDSVTALGAFDVGAADIIIEADEGGVAGNIDITFADGTPPGGAAASAAIVGGDLVITYDQTAGTATAAEIRDAINNADLGFTARVVGTATEAVGTGAKTATALVGGVDAVLDTTIDVTADTPGTAGNVTVSYTDAGPGGITNAIVNDEGNIVVAYDFAAATTAADIQEAIDALEGFSATVTGAGSTTATVAATGGTLAGGSANTAASAVVTIDPGSAGSRASGTFAVGTANVVFRSDAVGDTDITVDFVDAATGDEATFDEGTNTLTVTFDFDGGNNTLTADALAALVNTGTDVPITAAVAGDGTQGVTAALTDGTLTGGVDAVAATTLTVNAAATGEDGNVSISFVNDATAAVPTAALDDDGNIVVTYNQANATAATALRDAINNDLTDFDAVVAGAGTTTAGVLATGATLTGGASRIEATTIAVTAERGGAEGNVNVNFVDGGTGSSTTAALDDDGNIVVTYDFAQATSVNDLRAAIDSLEGFRATSTGTRSSTANTGVTNIQLSGGAETAIASTNLTIVAAQDAIAATGSFEVGDDEILLTANTAGAAGNITVAFADGGVGTGINVGFAGSTLTITYDQAANTSSLAFLNAINDASATTGFSADLGGSGLGTETITGDIDDTALEDGADAVTATTINVQAALGGSAGNVGITFEDTGEGTSINAALDTDGNIVVSYNYANATAASDLAEAIDRLGGFVSTATGTGSTSANVGATGGALTGGLDASTQDTITVTADDVGFEGNVAVNFIDAGTGGQTTAALNADTGAIEVSYDFSAAVTSEAIANAINTIDGFTATGGTATGATEAGAALSGILLSGGRTLGDSVPATGSTTITSAAAAEQAAGTITVGADTLAVRAIDGGTAGNVAINFIIGGTGSATTAALNSETGAIEVTYNFDAATSSRDIQAAINSVGGFFASGANAGTTVAGVGVTNSTLTGGTNEVVETTLTVSSDVTGDSGNVAVRFINGGTGTATSARLNSENGDIEVTYDFSQSITGSSIQSAINTLSGFTATINGSGSTTAGVGATNFTLAGGTSGGVQADVVFELAGSNGSEVFNITRGTLIEDVVSQINLVSDATGVEAAVSGTTLQLSSVGYGSKSVVDQRILSQAEGGNFGTGARDTGSDVVATINGRAADGDGNKLSINTATLDLTADLAANFTGTASFSITGGGAQFQLGPDVVSNQQARVGIGSVNSARLGGVSGKLFELGSGEAASLSNDTTRAAQIVTEAIDQVTSLRGRLGAFQSTTLESNLVSLNDAAANLQEAESSIRDADFAAESAALTRAQILVQSGTNVLSLANQNPQNVLSLLR